MSNVIWQQYQVNRATRAAHKGHQAAVLWFTGLSGSGKSTLANALEQALVARGVHTYLLDGDNVRHGLCADLGFSEADRHENIRRVGAVAGLLFDAGLVVLSTFISPYEAQRALIRESLPKGAFFEIHVSTSLQECERRDVKGLYQKARQGEIHQFTGISAPYEAPIQPDLRLDTAELSVENSVAALIDLLLKQGIIR